MAANLLRNLGGITIPMFHVSSWYDIFLEGALNSFQAIRERGASESARRNQKLLIGPWAHIRPYTEPTSGGCGDIDFGDNARIELHHYLLRWFDHWLQDIDSGITTDPPVYLFVMGENRWREEHEWPLARTNYTAFYLHSQGSANTRSGDGSLSTVPPGEQPADQFMYNPEDPSPPPAETP